MQRTIKMNFPDGFEFPEVFEEKHCYNDGDSCPFYHCDTYEPVEYCQCNSDKCPFYGKGENEVVEI